MAAAFQVIQCGSLLLETLPMWSSRCVCVCGWFSVEVVLHLWLPTTTCNGRQVCAC